MDSDQNAMAGNAAMTPEHIAGEEPGPGPVASGGWARLRPAMRWESGLVVVVIVIAIMGSALSPEFLTANNFFNLGINTGEIAIMALPMALIIISGEIDLSVESTLGMSSALLGVLWAGHWPMPAIFAVVAVGRGAGRGHQRAAGHPGRAAVAGGDDRHARPSTGASR